MMTPKEKQIKMDASALREARAKGVASMHITDAARKSIEETRVLLNDLARLTSQFTSKPE